MKNSYNEIRDQIELIKHFLKTVERDYPNHNVPPKLYKKYIKSQYTLQDLRNKLYKVKHANLPITSRFKKYITRNINKYVPGARYLERGAKFFEIYRNKLLKKLPYYVPKVVLGSSKIALGLLTGSNIYRNQQYGQNRPTLYQNFLQKSLAYEGIKDFVDVGKNLYKDSPSLTDISTPKEKNIIAQNIGISSDKKFVLKGYIPHSLPFHERTYLSELKAYSDSAATGVGSAGIFYVINNVALGTDYTQRIGRKITMKHLELQVYLTSVATQTLWRFCVLYDYQYNGVTPTITDLMQSGLYNGFSNLNNRDRFIWLFDKFVALNSNQPNVIYNQLLDLKSLSTIYNQVPQITTGALILFFANDDNINTPAFGYNTRIRYTD